MEKTVLVVDDDDSVRFVLTRALERLGHNVMAVSDGADVIDLVAQHHFDLLVLDLYMPGMNGFEVLRQVRQLSRVMLPAPATPAAVRILVVSGESHPPSLANAKAAGADAFLNKPVDIGVFADQVRALLDRDAQLPQA